MVQSWGDRMLKVLEGRSLDGMLGIRVDGLGLLVEEVAVFRTIILNDKILILSETIFVKFNGTSLQTS
jgi:hypothetical protein